MTGTPPPLSLYGLLFVEEEGERPVNLRGGTDPLLAYLRCAAGLHRSLARFGSALTLVSNRPALLRARLEREGLALAVTRAEFSRVVPPTLRFRAAHRKLDLIAAFGRGDMGARPGLLDLDMVMLNRLPAAVAESPGLVGYDIWDQVAAAYGAARIRHDVARVVGRPCDTLDHWWGGEFLVGPQDGFARLSEAVEALYPRYLRAAPELHHQGDEMLLAAAFHVLAQDGAAAGVADGGALGAVGRWWSARTLSPGARLRDLAGRSLLHLPADKDVLSGLPHASDGTAQTADLVARLRRKTRLHRLAAPLYPFLPGPRKYAPRL